MVYPVPWFLSALITFPQTIIVLLLGFSLLNLKLSFVKTIYISIIFSIFSYYLRKLSITLTANSLISILVIILITQLIVRSQIIHTSFSVLIGFITYAIIETMTAFTIFSLTKYDINSVIQNPWLDFLFFLPALIIAIILYILIKRFKLIIFDFNKRHIDVPR